MATYTGSIAVVAKIEPRDNAIKSSRRFGVHKSIDFAAEELYDITLTHPLIDTVDRATLKTFYDTNKRLQITTQALSDGYVYLGFMMGEPVSTEISFAKKTVIQKLLCWRQP